MHNIQHYLSDDGHDFFMEWLENLAGRQARARVVVRVQRMAGGNFGDCRAVGSGVWELRIDHGPGYRVYYAQAGKTLVLILTGGDKRTQRADIALAIEYWEHWNRRNNP